MRSAELKSGKLKFFPVGLPKCPTGIHGLDEITLGGLPRGRPTLVCGGPGSGKTLLGMEFLVRGATLFAEPGVCLSFEETAEELATNVASLGFDLKDLIKRKKLYVDYVYLDRSLIQETGEYDLEALFVRLGHAVDSIGAKRVLLDSVEALFAGLDNEAVLRSELRRLFRWLKDRNLTAVVTGERGLATLSRYCIEEYISDCIILLDTQVTATVLTRRLRVVKYRGSTHGMNEYPFVIENDGISVLPVTAIFARQEIETKQHLLQRKRLMLDAQIAALQLDLETDVQESQQLAQEKMKIMKWERDRGEMAKSRFADQAPLEPGHNAPARRGRK